MNEQKFPRLERLHILRKETLISIRDRAFDTFTIFLKDYSDGIISGCELFTTKNHITLSEGIIMHNKFLYLIKEPMSIDYEPTDKYMMVKMIFEPEFENENFTQRNISLKLTHDLILTDNEMEICRFKLKKGAVLRTNYTDFFDIATEFDTINLINVPFSSIGKSSISPGILKIFADEAKDFSLTHEDFCFCMAAMSGDVISSDHIAFYIEHRLKIKLPDKKNQTLYDNLCVILQEIKNGPPREISGMRNRRREIIVE